MTSLAFHQKQHAFDWGARAVAACGISSQREDSEPLFFFRLCWPEAAT